MNYEFDSPKHITAAQKLQISLLGMVVVILAGMIGFMMIENLSPVDALYSTVITLSTVGYGDITPHSPAGRVFVIFLILLGVVMTGLTVSTIGQMVIEGQFREIVGRKKMASKINKMKNHFIIAGYGRVGRQVAMEFKEKNVDFIVVEKDTASTFTLYKDGVLFVQGEATDEDILRKAGIDTAKTLISTLPDEAQNVYLTLTARDMNPELHIIARADFEDGEKKLKRAGANHVVSPHVLGGIRMAMASLRPNVVDFMHTTTLGSTGLSIEETLIPEGCSFAGSSLKDSGIKQKYGLTVIGVIKQNKEMVIGPGPDMLLEANDILVLLGDSGKLEKFSKQLN